MYPRTHSYFTFVDEKLRIFITQHYIGIKRASRRCERGWHTICIGEPAACKKLQIMWQIQQVQVRD